MTPNQWGNAGVWGLEGIAMDEVYNQLLEIGCILEQARGIAVLLENDSQSTEFSTQVAHVYAAIGAIDRLLLAAEGIRDAIEKRLIAERRQHDPTENSVEGGHG